MHVFVCVCACIYIINMHLLDVCVCMCTCVCTCMCICMHWSITCMYRCMCVCLYVYACVRHSLTLGIAPQVLSTFFIFKAESLAGLELDRVVCQMPGVLLPPPPQLWHYRNKLPYLVLFFCLFFVLAWILWVKLKSPFLCGKHFPM